MTVADACRRARVELSPLGDLADPLLTVLTIVERVGADRRIDALEDPNFALEVLTAGDGCDVASVGRLLQFLRQRTSAVQPIGPSAGAVSIADAVAQYERGALALMARGTQHTYRTWTKRLVAEHGDRRPNSLTAGDLTDLIAHHVLAKRTSTERRRSGRSAEENAVGAFRHLWGYLVEKRYADTNVAMRLRKPARVEPRRRGFTPEESALLRELARAGVDPMLDEITRGEYWLEPSWMINSDTENAMPANEIVAPAITPSSVRALSTVDVNPRGRSATVLSTRRSMASAARPSTAASTMASIGTKNRLERSRSTAELNRTFMAAWRCRYGNDPI